MQSTAKICAKMRVARAARLFMLFCPMISLFCGVVLFCQLRTRFSGRCGGVAVVERFKQEAMYGLSAGTKKSGRCGEVAVSGGSTVM